MSDVHDVLVLGAGMSGLCMGIKLRARGIDSFLILEKSAEAGGTWHDNRYPGAACDVPSVLYSFSFAPNPNWSRVFSSQEEIKTYLSDCAARAGLDRHLRPGATVRAASWQEGSGRWEVELENGERLHARALVSALGQLNRPRLPDIPGRDRFAGHALHSARWEDDCDVSGKRVAVIGSAASAVQIVPEIAKTAERVTVYQRSANYILKRGDRPYARWEKRLFRALPFTQKVTRLFVYLFGDGLLYPALRRRDTIFARFLTRRSARYRDAEIADPELRQQLTPNYPLGCKRVLFSDDFYAALSRDTVELVTSPITAMEAAGLCTEDQLARPVDMVIYATGFHATDLLSTVEIRGTGGQSLAECWRDGAEAYRGVSVNGFPNFFMLYGPNTNLGSNSIIFMVERQARYAVNCIDKLLTHDLRALEASEAAQRRYNERLQRDLEKTVWAADCDNWYRNAAGKVVNNWPYSCTAYWWHMRDPDYSDFDMRA